MPHIKLEYTDNIKETIDFSALFAELHQILANYADINSCKSRAVLLQNYYIGTGNEYEAFVHVNLKLLEGRTHDEKQQMGQEFLKVLQNHFRHTPKALNLQITVEINDMHRAAYFKYI